MRRRLLALVCLASLTACGGDREPLAFPSEPQGRLLVPEETESVAPPATDTFDVDGCPVEVRRMCQEASALANALTQANVDAVFTLSRPTTVSCADVDPEVYPQCDEPRAGELEGFAVAGAEEETFVTPEENYREQLAFMRDGLDPDYTDELGTGGYRIIGLATCEPGERYELVYVVGLGDPESTLPADRFLGTIELTEDGRAWASSRITLDILSDWQLYYDDPLAEIGCGPISSWDA